MNLKVQLYSFIASFIYGFFFFLMLEINSRFIYSSSKIVRIIASFLFVIVNVFLYFIILMRINNGYIHIYFFLCIILGYMMCKACYKFICKKK